MRYLDPEELVREIEAAQQSGVVSVRLIRQVERIAHGIWSKYNRWLDEDDYKQEALLQFLKVYQRCDTTESPGRVFNWVTAVIARHGLQTIRADQHRRACYRRYGEWLGSEIPEE